MAGHPLDIEPLPSVNPSGAPGGDFENIHADPAMFGGLIGKAEEGFGEGIEKLSNTGFQVAQQQREMQDKTHGAELHSWFSDQVTDESEKFLELKGRAAISALPQHKQKLQDLFQQALEQAPDPYTKQLVQQESRRTMDMQYQLAARHAAGQQSSWQANTAKAAEQSYGDQAVLFASNGDLSSARRLLFSAGQERRNQAEQQGYEGDALEEMTKQGRGHYVDEIVKAIARREGPTAGFLAASKFYKSEENNIDAGSRTRIEGFLNEGLTQIVGQEKGRDAWNHGAQKLSSTTTAVRSDAEAALEGKGIPLNVTSGYRSPEHNAAVGGARGSQHLEGKAIDVSLTGLTPDQQKTVVTQFLSDPRVGGFGYYPRSNSIHVDVRQGGRAAWGTDYHGTSVGEGWPLWLTTQVRAWQQAVPGWMNTASGQPGGQPGPERVMPASMGAEGAPAESAGETPAVPAGIVSPSRLPSAVLPTWEEKKAAALQQIMDDPELQQRPRQQAAAIAAVHRMAEIEHAQAIDDTAAARAQAKAEKQASDAAELTVLQDIYSPAPKTSASQMLQNPQLSEEAKRRLLTHYPKPEDVQHDTVTYGPGFFDAYRAVHAPVGDPGRLSDPEKIYDMVRPGGALTVAGADKLISEIFKPKTPETEAESAMKRQFLENAKREVSGEHGFAKLKDPKGDEIFLKFLGYFFPAYEKARKEGKTPGELLDPTAKDYLGKSLETMKRPMSTWYQDVLNDNPETATGQPIPANTKFDPAAVKDVTELQSAYMAGKIDRATASQIAVDKGWAARKPSPPAVAPAQPLEVPVSR